MRTNYVLIDFEQGRHVYHCAACFASFDGCHTADYAIKPLIRPTALNVIYLTGGQIYRMGLVLR